MATGGGLYFFPGMYTHVCESVWVSACVSRVTRAHGRGPGAGRWGEEGKGVGVPNSMLRLLCMGPLQPGKALPKNAGASAGRRTWVSP